MNRTFTLPVVSVGAALALLVSGLVAPAQALASTRPDRGIVCPRGQHAYHAPGGAVTCIPNGQSTPTSLPGPLPSVPTP